MHGIRMRRTIQGKVVPTTCRLYYIVLPVTLISTWESRLAVFLSASPGRFVSSFLDVY